MSANLSECELILLTQTHVNQVKKKLRYCISLRLTACFLNQETAAGIKTVG